MCIGGGIIGGISTAIQTKLALDEAKRHRSWQQHMSNTSYQRGMKDMRKAGLNPILAGRFGGASTPSGGMASLPNIAGGMAAGLSAATASRVGKEKIAHSRKQRGAGGIENGVMDAQIHSLNEAGNLAMAKTNTEEQNARNIAEQTKQARQRTKLLSLMEPSASAMAEYRKTKVGHKMLWWSQFLKDAVGPLNLSGSASSSITERK